MADKVVLFPARVRAGREGARPVAGPAAVSERTEVLVLGGTAEALLIAERLATRGDAHVVASLAGGDGAARAPVECDVRIGGFADAAALADFVEQRGVRILVDAADPFAAALRHDAADVARSTGVERVVYERPVHVETDDDIWIRVQDTAEAVDLLPGLASRVLLDLPAAELEPFARLRGLRFVLRPAAREDRPVPLADYERTATRAGTVEDEEALLRQHRVNMVVLRDNGSEAGARLLAAARAAAVPAMLLARPVLPPSHVLDSVDDLLLWVQARLEDGSDATRSQVSG